MYYFNQGDAATVALFYTENGMILPPNSGFVTGREAIKAFWQSLMDMGIKSMQLCTGEVESCGDIAYEVGKYVLDVGKYIVIWKRVNSGWELHRDIFNTSMPAP